MEIVERQFEKIEAQAIQWLIRLDGCRDSQELAAEHEAWLAANPRHKVAYVRHALAWKRMDCLRRMRPLDHGAPSNPNLLAPKRRWPWAQKSPVEENGHTHRSPAPRWRPALAGAGAFFGLIAAAIVLLHQPERGAEYFTDIGGQKHVQLSDGSSIDLNTDTRIEVIYSDSRRRILLSRGELMVSVAHDASRPFEVIAAGVTARAVGTRFSVRLHEDSKVETIVTEGRVLMLQQEKVLGIPIPMTQQPISHTLAAGERVVVAGGTATIMTMSAEEQERRVMWTSGEVRFGSETLVNVVRELNRYTRKQLIITDPRYEQYTVGGAYDTTHADRYASVLVSHVGNDKLALVDRAAGR